MPEFQSLPAGVNGVLFAVAAAVVWRAGVRTARYADAIAERTGIGRVLIGALLLGGITSLPELATTVTAAALGNAGLAVNNILGGICMQVAILAAADAVAGRRAITALLPQPSILLQAALLVLLLTLCATALHLGEHAVLGLGVWSTAILAASVLAFVLIQRRPARDPGERTERRDDAAAARNGEVRRSMPDLVTRTIAAAALILVAGYVVARTGDALADQTGLGDDFVGAVLVAIATSLPELSTTLGAVRLGAYGMAVSNLFGANILDLGILFVADAVYAGGPVLDQVGDFAMATVLLAILLTGIYIVGMLLRRRRAILRLGMDSMLVAALYFAGLYVLYRLR
jgi:cation:H+ antiporter